MNTPADNPSSTPAATDSSSSQRRRSCARRSAIAEAAQICSATPGSIRTFARDRFDVRDDNTVADDPPAVSTWQPRRSRRQRVSEEERLRRRRRLVYLETLTATQTYEIPTTTALQMLQLINTNTHSHTLLRAGKTEPTTSSWTESVLPQPH